MFAVIKTGGKQYRVAADQVLKIEKLEGEAGDAVTFDQVLMVGGEAGNEIGVPLVEGASVVAEITEQSRGRKVIAFKSVAVKTHAASAVIANITQLLRSLRS